MEYNSLDRMDLATYLCGYNQKPKSGTTEYDTCRKKSRTIAEHLKLENIQKEASLSAKYIADYCAILHCEPDYLFGYIDFPTHSETDINKEIGLSITSINSIQKLDATEKYILNAMFDTYPQMPHILHSLKENIALVGHNADIILSIDGDNTNEFKEISKKVTSRMGEYKSKEMFKYDISVQLNQLINSLFEDEYLINLSRKAFFAYMQEKYNIQTEHIENLKQNLPLEPEKPQL